MGSRKNDFGIRPPLHPRWLRRSTLRARERITPEFGARCIRDGRVAPPLHTGEYARSSLLALAALRTPRFHDVIRVQFPTSRVDVDVVVYVDE